MKGDRNLKGIELNNFRSLKDTGLQELSPITILVGKNSSGKSSFLRAFPLLKQSIEKRTSGPILWSGDVDDYVDFGSFSETVTNDGSKSIAFKFYFKISDYIGFRHRSKKGNDLNLSFKIVVNSDAGKDYVDSFILGLNSTIFSFDLTRNNICIQEKNEYINFENLETVFVDNRMYLLTSGRTYTDCSAFGFSLPDIKPLLFKQWDSNKKQINMVLKEFDLSIRDFSVFLTFWGKYLINDSNTNIEKLTESIYSEDEIQFAFNQNKQIVAVLLEQLNKKHIRKNELIAFSKLMFAYSIFEKADNYIKNYFKNVHYIAPLRATAERYYRLRNLAVDEVDYQGKNLAIFINSLNNKQLKNFQEWTLNHFGFSVFTDKSKGHISLLIKLEGSSKKINLSDTGFGYSQILPIITQIWELSSRTSKDSDSMEDGDSLIPLVVAIEQPELHLHPSIQAKLAKSFIACIKLAYDHGYKLQLLLETHSETIVNCFGKAIAKGLLDSKDISVILFEKTDASGLTIVKKSTYDDNGFLLDWPYGFFEAED